MTLASDLVAPRGHAHAGMPGALLTLKGFRHLISPRWLEKM